MKKIFLCLYIISTACISTLAQNVEGLTEKQIYTSDFTIDERPRLITFYIPADFNKTEACPVFFVLHDSAQTAKTIIKKYGDAIHAKADASASIIVYPDALGKHWNDNMNGKDSINDAGFISIMIDYFIQRYHGDPQRIYVIGNGNGGAMAYSMSYNSHNRLAAIASVAGYMSDGAAKKFAAAEPMPAIIFSVSKKNAMLSDEAVTQYWLARNKITSQPVVANSTTFCASATVIKSTYQGSADVAVYKNIPAACIESAIKTSIDFLLAHKKIAK